MEDGASTRSRFGPTEMKLIAKLQNFSRKIDRGEALSSLDNASSKIDSDHQKSRITVKILEQGKFFQRTQNATSVVDIPYT